MQFNDKFGMQDLFMNKELKGLFPQFTKKDKLQNVYSFEWVENKVANYIKSVFNGRMVGGEIIINGKFKDKFKEISAMKQLIENMFNNMPTITKNMRHNTRLLTPFQCVDQLKEIQDPKGKMIAMQIVFDNLMYNDNFKYNGVKGIDYDKRKKAWKNSVGLKRRNI